MQVLIFIHHEPCSAVETPAWNRANSRPRGIRSIVSLWVIYTVLAHGVRQTKRLDDKTVRSVLFFLDLTKNEEKLVPHMGTGPVHPFSPETISHAWYLPFPPVTRR